jgi:tRNA(Ile)-lysidine synthase
MAKSITPKKGATKKVAPTEEITQNIVSNEQQQIAPEPKKVKRVSIAKPKALIEKKQVKKTAEVDVPVLPEKPLKTPKKTTKKTSVSASIEEKQSEQIEQVSKPQKGRKSSAKKAKNTDAQPVRQAPETITDPEVVESASKSEESPVINDQVIDADGHLDDAAERGEEKLSRKERRLREWKERKKLKRLQHLQEKQQGKAHIETSEQNQEELPLEISATEPVQAQVISLKPNPSKNQKKADHIPTERKESPVKSAAIVTQDQQPKLLPLDKVGRDFPPLKQVETWGNAMSKAKVDHLPKQLEPILQKTVHFLEQEIRIKKPSVILVGVSGGIDSVVLLDLLAVISTRGWCTIHVAHCNHQLRGEASHQDESFVRRLASKYGLHFHHTSADVAGYSKEYNLGIEAAARIMRYQFFEKAAKACHADAIATAHHSDDNAETLLMNLMRGSGITGLAGIPPRRDLDKKLSYVRPILWLSKKDIEHYAKVRNLEWREDESNTSLNYTRNKIRHELLPMLKSEYSPGLTEVLNRTTTLMREAQEFIAERIVHIMKQGVREVSKSSFAINVGMFQTIKDFAKGELIQASLRYYLRMQPISMIAIDSILQLAQGPAGGRLDINKDLYVIRDREELVFARPEQTIEVYMPVLKQGTFNAHGIGYQAEFADPRSVNFGEHPLIEYFDADKMPEQCVIRQWRDGDRIMPIGMEGSMTVSDFLTNAKINVKDKRKVLVLCSGDEVLWIIGFRIHNAYKVTQQTNTIMRITISLEKSVNYLQSKNHKQSKTNQKQQQKPQQRQKNAPIQNRLKVDNTKPVVSEQELMSSNQVDSEPQEKKIKKDRPNSSASKRQPRKPKGA